VSVSNFRNGKIKNIPRFAFHDKHPHNLHVLAAIIIFPRHRTPQKDSCHHNKAPIQLLLYLSLFKTRDNAYDLNQLINTDHDWITLHRNWTTKLTLNWSHRRAVKSYKQRSLFTRCRRRVVHLRETESERIYSSLKAIVSLHVWWVYIFLSDI
jgi:hypothetical protein